MTSQPTHPSNIRILVRGAYDVQKLRIQMGNRIVSNFRAKLGQAPGTPEEDLDAAGKRILKELRLRYRKITDGVKNFPRRTAFKGDEVISDYTELCLLAQYVELEEKEAAHFKRLEAVLSDYPIYTEWLRGVKGIGPAMAGVLISEIDIHKARYASSLWKYAGLDVASDGKGRSRRKEHLVKTAYTNADGERAERDSITFSPFLKTKLVGVLGASFLRAGDNPYATIYRAYKHRLEHHAEHASKTKLHRHHMAIRYMIKMFLVDLYEVWRPLEGLECFRPYHEAKLGLTHREVA